jgi:hypothetical protein
MIRRPWRRFGSQADPRRHNGFSSPGIRSNSNLPLKSAHPQHSGKKAPNDARPACAPVLVSESKEAGAGGATESIDVL